MMRVFYYIFIVISLFIHKSVQEGIDVSHYWRPYNGTIPFDAFGGGSKTSYIGLADFSPYGPFLSTLYENDPTAYSFHATLQNLSSLINVQILCAPVWGHQLVWQAVKGNDLSVPGKHCQYVTAGYEDLAVTYIGRILKMTDYVIGKIFPHSGNSCKTPGLALDHADFGIQEYEILGYCI